MAVDQLLIDLWFTFYPVNPAHIPSYDAVREAAKLFAGVLLANTNSGPDQDTAFRKLREAVDAANHSIAFDGKS